MREPKLRVLEVESNSVALPSAGAALLLIHPPQSLPSALFREKINV